MAQLILLSPRKAPIDRELADYRRNGLSDYDQHHDMDITGKKYISASENFGESRVIEQDTDLELDNDTVSDVSDEDDDLCHSKDAKADCLSE